MAFKPADNPRHANSWYAASANDKRVRPALEGEIEADICVMLDGLAEKRVLER